MRFFVDEGLSPLACEVAGRYGHGCIHVRDAGLRGATDSVLADYARSNRLALVTLDFDFADVRQYPPEQYHGIVVLEPPPVTNRALTLKLLEQVLSNESVISHLTGRLVIAAFGLIRLRPPLD